jgi:phospholipase/carboxylesterase
MAGTLAGFTYRFEHARDSAQPPILLLHGTGGDESDLVPLGQAVAPGAALISPRGKVLENGQPRFFRRLAEGVLDEDDIRIRASELVAFIDQARARHDLAAPIALGFSNGANIAAAVMILHPGVLAGAILLRAMPPFGEDQPGESLGGRPVLLVSGVMDPIVPVASATRLGFQLRQRGATVAHELLPAAHQLSQGDIALARAWLAGPAGQTGAAAIT